ncbi:MAG: RidA family protein [Rhizobiales bacterium]|nr:RidA family protein [Hyphomicrobiales bacterium]
MSGERKNAIVHDVLQPPGWPAPRGYVNGVAAAGRMVFTGGLVGWDAGGAFPDGMAAQVRQALENTVAVLAEAGAGPEHIVRMTWYVTSVAAYTADLAGIGAAWRAAMGRTFPPMAVVEVVRLVEPAAMVEIETTAVVPG